MKNDDNDEEEEEEKDNSTRKRIPGKAKHTSPAQVENSAIISLAALVHQRA